MAIGLDLLIVALECAMIATAGTKAYKPVARFANPGAYRGFHLERRAQRLCVRAALYMAITAAALGASIPALIYAGTRAWAALAINARTA